VRQAVHTIVTIIIHNMWQIISSLKVAISSMTIEF
jgi:hypothetical protein